LVVLGAGRSEVSIDGMKANILNYSIKTIQPLSELNTNSKELTFFQGGIASNRSAPATSLSIVVAWLSCLADCGLFCW
jgi:hypothetical protein